MKRQVRSLCLVSLGLMSVLAFGAAGSASAANLLFIPHSGQYPYHFTGVGGKSSLVAGLGTVNSLQSDVLVLILSATLANVHIRFLKSTSPTLGNAKCSNTSESETILISLLAHLGLAHPGDIPAVLMLVPSGFSFKCGSTNIEVQGSVIGEIASPALNTASELMRVVFRQTKHMQQFQTFLLGNLLLTGQHEESNFLFGFEESAQEGEIDLKALANEGTFLLITP